MPRTARGSYGLRHYSRAKLTPRLFSYIADNPRIARRVAKLWGTDANRLYAEYARVRDIPDGTTVIDVPCGSGVTFHELDPGQRIDYTAIDLSPVMVQNARDTAETRELHQIQFLEASVDDLPFADESVDLVLTYNGLHCFPDPRQAVREMARVLRPGGELRGSSVTKSNLKSRLLVGMNQKANTMGYVGDVNELRLWLAEAGIRDVTLEPNGLIYFFTGVKA